MRQLQPARRATLGVLAAGAAAGMLTLAAPTAGAAPASQPDPARAACTWTVHALPELPGGSFAEVHGSDGGGTWAGVASDGTTEHAALWRRDRVVDLGTPLGGGSAAEDVNGHGVAVGSSRGTDGQTHAYLWRDGRPVRLGEPAGAVSSTANGINDPGLIVGTVVLADFTAHAAVWSAARPAQVRDLGTPADTSTFLAGVSQRGVLAGTRVDADFNQVAVTGTVRTGLHTLAGTVPGALTSATAAAGRYVVGSQTVIDSTARSGAVQWTRGRPALLPGSDIGTASAVNAAGLVAGNTFGIGAVAWRHGQRSVLPGLYDGAPTGANAVSDAGAVGGWSRQLTSGGQPNGATVPVTWSCR